MLVRAFRVLAIAGCAALLLGTSRCQTTGANNVNGPVFVTSLTTLDANNQPAGSFSRGQSVTFQLSVRNRSQSAQTLWFNTAQQYNFAVVAAGTGNVVWYWSAGQLFTQGFTSLTFQPGQARLFAVSWNQTNTQGQLVSAGSYEVLGGVTYFNTSGASGPANNGGAMATGIPAASQLMPTQYVSSLVPFSIQ